LTVAQAAAHSSCSVAVLPCDAPTNPCTPSVFEAHQGSQQTMTEKAAKCDLNPAYL